MKSRLFILLIALMNLGVIATGCGSLLDCENDTDSDAGCQSGESYSVTEFHNLQNGSNSCSHVTEERLVILIDREDTVMISLWGEAVDITNQTELSHEGSGYLCDYSISYKSFQAQQQQKLTGNPGSYFVKGTCTALENPRDTCIFQYQEGPKVVSSEPTLPDTSPWTNMEDSGYGSDAQNSEGTRSTPNMDAVDSE